MSYVVNVIPCVEIGTLFPYQDWRVVSPQIAKLR